VQSPARHSVGAQRHDHDRARSNSNETIRNAAEERRPERTTPSRADGHELGALLVSNRGELLGRQPDRDPLCSLWQPAGRDNVLEQAPGCILLPGAILEGSLIARSCDVAGLSGHGRVVKRNGWRVRNANGVSDMSYDKAQAELIRQSRSDLERGFRLGRSVDTADD